MGDEDTKFYVGFDRCGCVVAVVADNPKWRANIAEDVAQMIRNGYTVERVPELPKMPLVCPHDKKRGGVPRG